MSSQGVPDNPYWWGARQRWGQLAGLEQLISWPVAWRRCLRMLGAGTDSTPSAKLLLFYFDTNARHAHVPAGEEVQRWRAGLNHSVERQTQHTILGVIWVWWGLGTWHVIKPILELANSSVKCRNTKRNPRIRDGQINATGKSFLQQDVEKITIRQEHAAILEVLLPKC